MIFLILLILAAGLPLAYHRYIGVRAMTAVSVEISGLTLEQIVDIGAKASTPAVKRLLGRPQTFQTPDGEVGWNVGGSGGVMTFLVEALPSGGFRITGRATGVVTAHVPGGINPDTAFGRAKFMTLLICKLLHIPHNARQLLRRRRRAFNALARAGKVIVPESQHASTPTASVPQSRQ
jgi:hypothetical protein